MDRQADTSEFVKALRLTLEHADTSGHVTIAWETLKECADTIATLAGDEVLAKLKEMTIARDGWLDTAHRWSREHKATITSQAEEIEGLKHLGALLWSACSDSRAYARSKAVADAMHGWISNYGATPTKEPAQPATPRPTGLYAKFKTIERSDGRSAEGEKHHGCQYFVLDITHDKFAPAALEAYAEGCQLEYPELARDLKRQARLTPTKEPAPDGEPG